VLCCADYSQYPNDVQTISITTKSYAFKSDIMLVNFTTEDAVIAPGGYTLPPPMKVQEWGGLGGNPTWDLSNYVTSVDPTYAPDPNGETTYTFALLTITAARKPAGIVNRLAFPIMLMLLLVGLTFWSDYADRLDTTITILLAVSALYIVIFSSIPMYVPVPHCTVSTLSARTSLPSALFLCIRLCVCVCLSV
jgi:hypothetical protein